MKLKYILVFIVTAMLLLPFETDYLFSKTRAKKSARPAGATVKKSIKKAKAKSSSRTKSKKSGRRGRSRRVVVETGPFTMSLVKDSTLSPGIVYKNLLMGRGRNKHSVHVLETDITYPENSLLVLKAKENVGELQRLHDIMSATAYKENFDVLGAVNANFWQAFSNRPIGPTVINGEVIEMVTHKNWSSAFFDENNRLFIGNIHMTGTIRDKKGNQLNILSVNRRKDKNGIVLYNHYAGDTLPFVRIRNLQKFIDEAIKDSLMDDTDSTEDVIDTAQIQQELMALERSSSIEYSIKKLELRYLSTPAVNKKIACRIDAVDTGSVAIPVNGVIVSLGEDFVNSNNIRLGDTLFLEFSTDEFHDKVFVNSVAGTPRLVREGLARQEAVAEGSRGRRFISNGLARTAIGTNECGEIVYLVAVEPSSEGRSGANLAQMSAIMKNLGAYNAMNLDGGGSSIMVMNNMNLVRGNRPDYSRKISVGLAAARKRLTVSSGANRKK